MKTFLQFLNERQKHYPGITAGRRFTGVVNPARPAKPAFHGLYGKNFTVQKKP
jgi:hypothetical protein